MTTALSLTHLSKVNLVLLHEGATSAEATGLEESEHHATTDDELVDLVEERLNHSDLGGHLGTTHNGSEGALGLGDGTLLRRL